MKGNQEIAKSRSLHLCDFDGTLTKGDTLSRFLLFAVPWPRLAVGSVVLIFKFLQLLLSGQWSNEAGKAAVLSEFFKGKTIDALEGLGIAFCQQKIPKALRGSLLESLREAKQKGDTVVIVSASLGVWLRPFCTQEGFDLLCTELAFQSGVFTGSFATPNCKGPEKARRIREAYDLAGYKKIIAYGDSRGDYEMFALADEVLRF